MGNVIMEASQINYRGGETKMSVEQALKETSGEAAAIAALQEAVGGLQSDKADLSVVAPAFSAEASYDVGDIVAYAGVTYRCTNSHEGEWDADDFAATTVAGELSSLESGLTNLHKIEIIPITAPSNLTSTAVGGNAEIPIEAGYNGNLIIGVYLYVHAQNRGVLGYFNQSTIVNNTIVLLDLNKQIGDSDMNSAHGFALVVKPTN